MWLFPQYVNTGFDEVLSSTGSKVKSQAKIIKNFNNIFYMATFPSETN